MSTPSPRSCATAEAPVVAHCRSGTRSTLLWALTRMREGADPLGLIAEAQRHGIDIASLPAVALALQLRGGKSR